MDQFASTAPPVPRERHERSKRTPGLPEASLDVPATTMETVLFLPSLTPSLGVPAPTVETVLFLPSLTPSLDVPATTVETILFPPSLTPSLPRCHLKATDKKAKFDTLKPFRLLFRIGT